MANGTQGKENFLLYATQRRAVEELTDIERGRLLLALYELNDGEDPAASFNRKEDRTLRTVYSMISDQMKRDARKYEEKCETYRQNAKKRRIE